MALRFISTERARLTAAVRLCGRVAPLRRTTAMRNAGMPFRFTPCHTVTSHQPRALSDIHFSLFHFSFPLRFDKVEQNKIFSLLI